MVIKTNGLPDEVMAVAASYDKTLRYGAQTPFSDQMTYRWEGGKWEYDANHDSIITAGNGGTKPIKAGFAIYYNRGTEKYQVEQTLQPDDQMWIDIGDLIRRQVPDKDGKTLPVDLSHGSYQFEDLTNHGFGSLFEGKVIYDLTNGHVSYGCASCCAYIGAPWIAPTPLNVVISKTGQIDVFANDGCDSYQSEVLSVFTSWTSANTGVATVNATTALVTGMSPGTADQSSLGDLLQGALDFKRCKLVPETPRSPANVIQVLQSPATIGMSSGDTNYAITVTVAPASAAALGEAIAPGFISNLNSSTTANLTFTPPASFTGNDSWTVGVTAAPNFPSGIFSATACDYACSKQSTTITVPPQILIQMFVGEAGMYSAYTMEALGSSVLNRFGSAHAYFTGFTSWQNTLICTQYDGVCSTSGVTTGVQPELGAAIPVFNTTIGDIVGGSACFFSPNAAGWTTIQQMLASGTTVLTSVAHDPGCYSLSTRQYVYKASIDNTAGGVPTFIFVRLRSPTSPAVVQIP